MTALAHEASGELGLFVTATTKAPPARNAVASAIMSGDSGYLPIGEGPLTGRAAKVGSLELHAGSHTFLSRFRIATGKSRATVSTVLNLAMQGDVKAQEAIHPEADLVSRAVLSTVALLDPAFVVLGGEIGSHPLVADAVRSRMQSIAP